MDNPPDNLTSDPSLPSEPSRPKPIDGMPLQPQTFSPTKPAQPLPVMPAPPAAEASEVPPHMPQFMPALTPPRKQKSKKRLFLFGGVALVVVALLAGYTFAFYLPNRPENIFKTGLERTGQATDKLLDYADQQYGKTYKTIAFDGSAKVVSPSGSFDASAKGAISKDKKATASIDTDIMGEKVHGDFRAIVAKDQTTPDVYLKVTGIKNMLTAYGMQGLDGKWVVVDHTIFDTFLQRVQQTKSTDEDTPTYAQVHDATLKVQAVNKQYIFTTDKNTAVLGNEHFLGKDSLNGRLSYHYKTGYNKAHLEAYVDALKKAVDESQLNVWAKAAQRKNASELLNLDHMKQTVSRAKPGYTFDLWIDSQTKLVNQLTFANATDGAGKITFAQNYTGGSKYPFSLTATGMENDKPVEAALHITIDSATDKISSDFSATQSGDSGKTTITANFSLTPSSDDLNVEVPKGAKSLTELIAEALKQAQASPVGPHPTNAMPNEGLFTLTSASVIRQNMLPYKQ